MKNSCLASPARKAAWLLLCLALVGFTPANGIFAQSAIDCSTFWQDGSSDGIYNSDIVEIKNGISYVAIANSVFATLSVAAFDADCNEIFSTQALSVGVTVNGIEVADNGDVYVFGNTRDASLATDGSTVVGTTDAYVVRFTPDGVLDFGTLIGSADQDFLFEVQVYDGGFYASGNTFGNNTITTTDGTTGTPFSFSSEFTVRYDENDQLVFATVLTNTNLSGATGSVVYNGVYYVVTPNVASNSSGALDPSTYGGGSGDLLLYAYDEAGNQILGTFIGGEGLENVVTELAIDDTGIYLATTTTSTEVEGTMVGTSSRRILVVKTDFDGNVLYSTLLNEDAGVDETDRFYDLKVVDGMAYVSGASMTATYPVVNGLSNPSPGQLSYVVTKLDANGEIAYSTFLGGSGRDGTNFDLFVADDGTVTAAIPGMGAITTDGTSGTGYVVYQLNPDGSLCQGTTAMDGLGFTAVSIYETTVSGDTVRFWVNTPESSVSTDNTTATATQLVEILLCPEVPPLAAAAVSPAIQNVCSNEILDQLTAPEQTIDGSGFPAVYLDGALLEQPDAPLSYQWEVSTTSATGPFVPVDGVLGTLQNYSPPPTTQTIYYRRLTTLSECCGGTVLTTSTVATIEVGTDDAPQVDAGEGQFSCPNAPVTIGVDPAATGGTPPYTYLWSNGANTPTQQVSPATSTIYTLSVTDANGCDQVDQTSVTVYSANAGPDVDACGGESVQIGGAPIPGATILAAGEAPTAGQLSARYAWMPTTGLSCSDCPLPMASASGDYTLEITIFRPDGSSCTTTDMVTVAAKPDPIGDAGPDAVVCLGDMETLGTASITGQTYSWAPGAFLDATNTAQVTFNPGSAAPPQTNPITYTRVAELNGCSVADQVSVAVIEARAGIDACGPRFIGEADRTPNIDETYQWNRISDPSLTTTTEGDLTGPTDVPITSVSGNESGQVAYELVVSFTLNGVTGVCRDTVIVPPCGGCLVTIEPEDGGCPAGTGTTLVATPGLPNGLADSNYEYAWTPEEGLDAYTGQRVTLTDEIERTFTVTVTSPLDPDFECTETITVNSPSFSPPQLNVPEMVDACLGDVVNIGDPAANPSLNYVWEPEQGLSDPTSGNPSLNVTGSAEYRVTVTDPVTSCTALDTVRIVVPQIADAGGDRVICDNGVVALGNNNLLPGYTYSWVPANTDIYRNGTTPADAQVEVFVATTTTFTLTVTSPSGTCVTTDQVLVEVFPLPPVVALSDLSYCPSQIDPVFLGYNSGDGSPTGVNEVPDNAGQNFSYSWAPANLLADPTVRNPQLVDPLPQMGATFELTLVGQGGCNQVSNLLAVTVPSPPVVVNNQTICAGESIFIGSPANEVGSGISYAWTLITDLDDPTSPNPQFSPTAGGEFTFTVTKSDANQVPTCMVEASVTIVVEEVVLPVVDPVTLCPGGTAQIGVDPEPGFQYQFSPATGLDDANVSNPTFIGTESTNYTLTVVDPNGCIGQVAVPVTVLDLPEIVIVQEDIDVCYSDQTTVDLSPTVSPASDYAYQWSPARSFTDPTSLTTTYLIAAPGTYDLTLTVIDQTNGCSVDEIITVTASQLEESCTAGASSSFLMLGQSAQLTASDGGVSYAWNGPDGFTSAEQNPTVGPLTEADFGNYEVEVTYASGCATTCDVTLFQAATIELPPCELRILEEFVTCTSNDDGTYTFRVTGQVFYNNAPAGETIEVSVGGVTETITPDADGNGSISLTPVILTTPGFDVPITATFSTTTGCTVTELVDLIACTDPCTDQPDEIGGNVFNDGNNDGADAGDEEVGESNVLVRVYACDSDEPVCEVYTNAEGNWTCDGLTEGEEYRVEFSTPLQPGLSSSFAGTDNGSDVQFVMPGTCEVDYGVIYLADYCDPNPIAYTTCYINGATEMGGASDGSLVLTDFSLTEDPAYEALSNETGSIWGVAATRRGGPVFTSSFMRRHVGLGGEGLGGIYAITGAGTPAAALVTVADMNDFLDLGDFDLAARDLGGPLEPSFDVEAFSKTVTVGLGDLDFAEAEESLYTVNLNTKEVVRIDVSGFLATGATITAADVTTLPPFPMTCSNGESRPFGLKYYRGDVYVGVVCDASGSNSVADLTSSVYRYTGGSWVGVITDIPMDYPRSLNSEFGSVTRFSEWQPWTDTFDDPTWTNNQAGSPWITYPQPMLSDIEFDKNGNMILGFADRGGFQMGWFNYQPDPAMTDVTEYAYVTSGDLLFAENRNGTYVLENNGTDSEGNGCGTTGGMPSGPNGDGPGGNEFFCGDFTGTSHGEVLLGGIAYFAGSDEVISSAMDPVQNTFGTGGLRVMSTLTGEYVRGQDLYSSGFFADADNTNTFGKGGGIGDVELLCDPGPVQIGNFAWIDENADGVQQACEPPLEGLAVKLYRKDAAGGDPVLIATDTTDAAGNYYFSDDDAAAADADQNWLGTGADTMLVRDEQYFVAFCGDDGFDVENNGLVVDGMTYCIAPANVGEGDGADQNDSDITTQDIGGVMLPAYCTTDGEIDVTNHTFDAGFKPVALDTCGVTIGAVQIVCNDQDDFTLSFAIDFANSVDTNMTIEVLLAGVPVAGSPFTAGVDTASISVTGITVADPAFNVPLVARFVGNESGCSAFESLDFIACTPPCDDSADEVGGNVFLDGNNDGNADATEAGQGNVLVRVYDCNENLICEVYTNDQGNWSCDGAMAGDTFRVEYTTPLSPELEETVAGAGNGTSTQFVIGGTCDANYGVINTELLCQDDPTVVVACYVSNNNNREQDVLVSFGYNDDSEIVGGEVSGPASLMATAFANQVASTWGLAYNRNQRLVYAAAVLKRHAGLSDAGLDAIFTNDPFSGTPNGEVWLELGDLGIDVGQNDVADESDRFISGSRFSYDVDAFSQAGTIGIGDMDFSSDMKTIYLTNIKEGTLLEIDVATKTLNNTYPVPSPCQGGNFRLWAIEVHEGQVYVGGVCDAFDSQNTEDLRGVIMTLNGSTFSEVLSFPLDYTREQAWRNCEASAGWNAWTNDTTTMINCQRAGSAGVQITSYPQPMLTDIEFDDGNNIIIGMSDRNGFMWGSDNYRPDPNENSPDDRYSVYAGGDILRACARPSGNSVAWRIEAAGTTCANPNGSALGGGPGMMEFYAGDFFDSDNTGDTSHAEVAIGSLVFLPGSGEIMTTVYDPVSGGPFFGRGGVVKLSNTTGLKNGVGTEIYGQGLAPDFSKWVGLGDLVLLCDAPTLQIGNYAWLDEDGDGLQDPCEPPLAGLAVKLYRKDATGGDPVLIATDTTDATGNYYFSTASAATDDDDQNWLGTDADTAVQRTENYFVAFCGDDGYNAEQDFLAVNGQVLCVSPADAGQDPNDDQNDSDVSELMVGAEMLPAYCTEDNELLGGTNHTFDAGFKLLCPFVELVPTVPSICSTDSVTLSTVIDSVFVADPYEYTWSTSGDGMFVDAAGMATTDYAMAATYLPGATDRTSGAVTLTLRATAATTPAACEEAVDMITITILNVDCGSFFWDGQD